MDPSLIKLLSKESKMKQEKIEEKLSSALKVIQYVISFNYEEKYTESVTLSGNYKFVRLNPFSKLSFKKVFLSTSSRVLESQVRMNAEGKGEVKIKDLGNFQNEIEITFNGKGKEMEVYELEFKVVFTNELLKDIKKYLEIQEKVYGTRRLFSINFNAIQSPILRYRQSLFFPRLKEATAIEAKYLNKKGFPEKFKVLDFLKVNKGLTEFSIDFPDFGYIGIIYEIE
ncbi:hypothetical protein [Acidianus ambivalens]|uniref:Uncharacterized protein n=1 Tax=Acidianus ambivalens TaxID=2283 RepID=A0A650CTT5_ACIAM|nr:hypothetical protein [Acidianus ambivalens]MQL56198.1 hypothetical protein [Acidianus ambivalens]QGR21264.1 hypothetical protein D1866_04050 [Acidianus ambivalens]